MFSLHGLPSRFSPRQVGSAVSRNTDLLVIGGVVDPEGSKEQKAKELGAFMSRSGPRLRQEHASCAPQPRRNTPLPTRNQDD